MDWSVHSKQSVISSTEFLCSYGFVPENVDHLTDRKNFFQSLFQFQFLLSFFSGYPHQFSSLGTSLMVFYSQSQFNLM